jgi:multiple sugar transport system permease protein
MGFQRNKSGASVWRYVTLLLVTVVMIGPLLWMLRVALAPIGSELTVTALVSPEFSFSAFANLFSTGSIQWPAINSLLVGLIVTAGNVLFCFMSGYALARKAFPGRKALFTLTLLILMIPAHILIVPLFLLLTKLGMFDTYWALILPFLVTPIGIFMVKQYVETIPVSLEEAARLDGASEWRTLFSVVAPVFKPILAVLAIQTFLVNWNSFLFPFILTNSTDLRTLPVALALMQGHQAIDWQHLMAGSTVAVIPALVVFLIFQKRIVSGITAGAIKQ